MVAALAGDRISDKSTSSEHPGRDIGGGLPVIQQWAKYTLDTHDPKAWEVIFKKSACLFCAWGTGGQKGGAYWAAYG